MPSRTRLPKVTKASRRAALAAATRILKAASSEGAAADPLVLLWREWRLALATSQRLCRDAQRLERQLADRIGFPRIEVPAPDQESGAVSVTDPRQIDRAVGESDTTLALRRRLKRELAEQQARWKAEADACGYTAAQEREAVAGRRVEELLRAAAMTPACSLTGVIAKLAIASEWALSEPEADGYPWAFLSTALAALTEWDADGRV